MRFLVLVLLATSFWFLPYPLEGKTEGKKGVGGEGAAIDVENVKGVLNLVNEILFENWDKTKFTQGLIHLAKVYGDKQIMEMWYKLSETERQCIIQSKDKIYLKFLTGQLCVTTGEFLKTIQGDCPNSKDQLQKIYDRKVVVLKEQMEKIKKYVGELPKSLQQVYEKLVTAIKNLNKDCGYFNSEKLRKELLPVLEQRLKVPDEDLKKFAELCPDLAPILTGDLKFYVNKILRSLITYFKTGDFGFMQHVNFMRGFVKMTPFWRQRIQKLMDLVGEKQEQTFDAFIVKGIEKEVPQCVEKMEEFLKEKPEDGQKSKRMVPEF